jgi:hypothetical protein
MAGAEQTERKRGLKESQAQITLLRAKWPVAFPTEHDLFRPLASSAPREVAAACGWSLPYTRGVLQAWKSQAAYCLAVLAHRQRILLDGSLSDEEVDVEAIGFAKRRLAELAPKTPPPPKSRPVFPARQRPRR